MMLRSHIENGFKCYRGEGLDGTQWAFVAVKRSHPYHGKAPAETPLEWLSWASSGQGFDLVKTEDRPHYSRFKFDDWIFGFDEKIIRKKDPEDPCLDKWLTNLSLMLKHHFGVLPPDFMIEDFKDSVMPELIHIGDSTEHRRECWEAFVEMCIGNKCITMSEAQYMMEPPGLTDWPAKDFL